MLWGRLISYCFRELRTPVVTLSESPWASSCSANLLTSSIFFLLVPSVTSSGVVAPEVAPDAFADPAFDLPTTVFLTSLPAAAFLAIRASLDEETMIAVERRESAVVCVA
jgi:hypothetical protein